MIGAARWFMFSALCLVALTTWTENLWTIAATLTSVLIASALFFITHRRFDPPRRHAAVIQWILAAIPLLALAQLLTGAAVYAYPAVIAAAWWCALAGVFFIATQLFRPASQWTGRFALFAAAVAALALLQRFTAHGRFLWIFDTGFPDIHGPFPSYKDNAAFTLLAFPFALSRGLAGQWPFIGASALLAASVIASGSRAGAVLLIGQAFLIALKSRFKLAAILTIAAMLAMSAAAGWDHLWSRFRQPDPYRFRLNVLLSSFDMIRDRPLTGFGLGNFETAYPAYARFDDGTRVNHAHNEWAEWTVEGGLPLTAALVAVGLLLARSQPLPSIAFFALLLYTFTDFPLRRLGVACWFAFLAAAALQRSPEASHGL
jgi:O-antigen ligase